MKSRVNVSAKAEERASPPSPTGESGYSIVSLSGLETPELSSRTLQAGPLTVLLEGGDLRYVRVGGREVIRRVYGAVRDRHWGTVPMALSNLMVEQHADSFHVSFDAAHVQGEIDFRWRGTIIGKTDGCITMGMDGVAHTTFPRNRIGLCLLHPSRECAGKDCVVEHSDGLTEAGWFPVCIAPHQPFRDIVAIRHRASPALWVEARFAGETFEMEDQRNWTDASFKIYGTPLALPFPAWIEAGTRVLQSITIRIIGPEPPYMADCVDSVINVTLAPPSTIPTPRLGLGMASHDIALSERERKLLRTLRPNHLRVDLDMTTTAWRDRLRRAVDEARALDCSLEAALFLPIAPEDALAEFADTIADQHVPIGAWLLFPREGKVTVSSHVQSARRILGKVTPEARFGGGTNAYFAEVNREHPRSEHLDFVCYSVTPQVHAVDNASLAENLDGLRSTVRSARRISGDRPIAVTPVTFRPRYNHDGTGPVAEPSQGELPPSVDPRQMSLFGAAWTIGCLRALAEEGASSATLFETTGWRGVMETSTGSTLPGRFPSEPEVVFPIFHALSDIGEMRGGVVVPLSIDRSLEMAAFAMANEGGTRVLMGNLTGACVLARLCPVDGPVAICRRLDDANMARAGREPDAYRAATTSLVTRNGVVEIELSPYAMACVDLELARGNERADD